MRSGGGGFAGAVNLKKKAGAAADEQRADRAKTLCRVKMRSDVRTHSSIWACMRLMCVGVVSGVDIEKPGPQQRYKAGWVQIEHTYCSKRVLLQPPEHGP